jgi:hypothetical protein
VNSETLGRAQILKLFIPLAATSTMMSASVPIINAGLARLASPEANLAAFGLAFGISILLESPVFALQQAVTAWYPGHGSVRHFITFAAVFGVIVFLFEAAVAYGPLAQIIFGRWLGAETHLAEAAGEALKVAIFFSPVIAVRCALQAILVSRRQAGPIGWGTFIRLLLLAVLVIIVAPKMDIAGPTAGMAALLAAVIVETVFVGLAVGRSPEYQGTESPAQTSKSWANSGFIEIRRSTKK